MNWKEIVSDPDFQGLSDYEKREIANKFFKQKVAKSDDFRELSGGEKKSIREKIYTMAGLKPEPLHRAKNLDSDPAPGTHRFLRTMQLPIVASLGGALFGGPGALLAIAAEEKGRFMDPMYERLRKREADSYKGMFSHEAKEYDKKRSGVLSDIMDGMSNSAIGRYLYSLHDKEDQNKIESVQPYHDGYTPRYPLVHSVANVLTDAPLYAAGSGIAAVSQARALAGKVLPGRFLPGWAAGSKTSGAFMFPGMLREMTEAKIRGDISTGLKPPSWKKLGGVMVDMAKAGVVGYGEGIAVHAAGAGAFKVADKYGLWRAYKKAGGSVGTGQSFEAFSELMKGTPNPLLSLALRTPAVTTALTGVDQIAQKMDLREDVPFDLWETLGHTGGTVLVLEALGLRPRGKYGIRTKVKKAEVDVLAEATGEKPRDIIIKSETEAGRNELVRKARDYAEKKNREGEYEAYKKEKAEAKEGGYADLFEGTKELETRKNHREKLIRDMERDIQEMAPVERIKKYEKLIEQENRIIRRIEEKYSDPGKVDIPIEVIKETTQGRDINPQDILPRMKEVYEDGVVVERQRGKYPGFLNRPVVREKVGKAVETIKGDLLRNEGANPGTIERIMADKSLLSRYVDPSAMDKGAARYWKSPRMRDIIEREVMDWVESRTRVNEKDLIEKPGRYLEVERPIESTEIKQKLAEAERLKVGKTKEEIDFLERTGPQVELKFQKEAPLKTGEGKPFNEVMKEAGDKSAAGHAQTLAWENATMLQGEYRKATSYMPEGDMSQKGKAYAGKWTPQLAERANSIAEWMGIPKDKTDFILDAFMSKESAARATLDMIRAGEKIASRAEITGLTRDMLENPYHKIMGQFYQNPSRFIRNLGGIEGVNLFLRPFRDAETRQVVLTKMAQDSSRNTRKKIGASRVEEEQATAYMISLQEGGDVTLRAMGAKAPTFEGLSPKSKQIVEFVMKRLESYLEPYNAARRCAGMKEIKGLKDYFTMMRKFTIADELGLNPLFSEAYRAVSVDAHSRGVAFGYGKERIVSRRSVELDPFYVLDRYEHAVIKAIEFTPVVSKMRDIISTPKFKHENGRTYAVLEGMINHLSGNRLNQKGEFDFRIVNSVFNKLNRNVGAFTLAWNVGTVAIQPMAYILTYANLGIKYSTKGLMALLNKEKREYAELHSNLSTRMSDISLEESMKAAHSKISKGRAKATEWGTLPMRIVDYYTAMGTWLSSFEKQKNVLGINKLEAELAQAKKANNISEVSRLEMELHPRLKEAHALSNEVVVQTQGSASRIDLAPVQRTPAGKAFTLFQTFIINQWNYLLYDVVRNENLTAGQKSMILGRYIAATMLMNTIYEIAGYTVPPLISEANTPGPNPLSEFYETINGRGFIEEHLGPNPMFGPAKRSQAPGGVPEATFAALREALMLHPMGGATRYGGHSLGGAAFTAVVEALNTASGNQRAKPMWYHVLKFSGIPGGQQAWKAIKAATRDNYDDESTWSALKDSLNFKVVDRPNERRSGGIKPLRALKGY